MPLTLEDFDAAVVSSMNHGAMPVADPLVDSLYGQLEGPAVEGALPPSRLGTGLTDAQRAALADAEQQGLPLWVYAVAAVAAAAASALWPMGFTG